MNGIKKHISAAHYKRRRKCKWSSKKLEDECIRARLSRREVQKFLEDTESHVRPFRRDDDKLDARKVGNKADQIAHELTRSVNRGGMSRSQHAHSEREGEDDSDKESQENHEDRRRSRSIEL